MTKPKVLLLLHDLTLTGSPKAALDAFEQLNSRFDLRIVCPEGGALEERCRRVGPLQLIRVRTPPKPLPRPSRQLVARLISLSLQKWRPDVIYANSLLSLDLAGRLRLPLAPVLLHVHEQETSFDSAPGDYRRLLQWPQRFIAVSEPVRSLLTARYGIAEDRVSLIHPFVRDEDFQSPPPAPTRADRAFVVGGAGQPQWRKGTTLWLQTAVELKRLMGDRPVRFVWVGVRDNLDSYTFQEEARKHGIADCVEFVPATKEPLPHYARFDVFAMTSWEDPCPVVVHESMMLKTPVACFAGGGGSREIVGDTGIVIPDFNPGAMARAIAGLAAEPARLQALGEAARERIGEHFTACSQVPKIGREIQALAVGGRGGARPFPHE